jgi:hypothetical protein
MRNEAFYGLQLVAVAVVDLHFLGGMESPGLDLVILLMTT